MQDIEKNMDDLFRKAVENYQPNSGESNWDKIASQLSTNPVIPPVAKEKNNIKKYLLILSFLLLSFSAGWLLTKYIVAVVIVGYWSYEPSTVVVTFFAAPPVTGIIYRTEEFAFVFCENTIF